MKATKALVAMLTLATLAGLTNLTVPASALPNSLDQSWMETGYVLQFHAGTVGGGDLGGFNVIVGAVDSSSITFDFVAGAPPKVQQITYDKTTRSASNGAGSAWLFVNQADINAGGTFIGDEYAAVTPLSNPALVEFSTATKDYFFSAVTGLLVAAQDEGTQSTIALIASAPGLVAPPADNDGSGTVQALTVGVVPGSPTVVPVGGGVSPHITRFLQIPCEFRSGYPTLKPLGVTQTCSGQFNVNGGFSIPSPDAWWPLLADGAITMTISDSLGTYYGAGCTSVLPATSGNAVACSGGTLRNFVFGGVHTVNVRANFGHCLNPLTLFGCPWAWYTYMNGEVTCVSNCEDRPI